MHKNKRKIIYGILLLAVIALNLFLTLQSQEGTVRLSEGVRHWIEQFGHKSDFHTFRSNAHIIVFFILGILLTLFGKTWDCKWWHILLLGFTIGLLDEGIKVFLPTREFDFYDLLKDWIGIGVGFLIVNVINRIGGQRNG